MGRARGGTSGEQDAFAPLLGTRRGLNGDLASRRAADDEERLSRPRPFPGPHGAKAYYRNNNEVAAVLHREDGPAVEYSEGIKEWWRNGQLHREDGPAIEQEDGNKEWWRDGQLHREDGPAVEHAEGDKEWYRDGQLHREDGPAVMHVDGYKEWYRDGLRHREDGPAVECADGTEQWWLNGELQPSPQS